MMMKTSNKNQTDWTIALGALLAVLLLISDSRAQQGTDDYVAPKLLSSVPVEYPLDAKGFGIEGKVSVRVKVDAAGNVLSADEPRGLGRMCGKLSSNPIKLIHSAVIDAAKSSKFVPGSKAGGPVEAEIWVTATIKPPGTGDGSAAVVDKKGAIVREAKSLPKPEYPPSARASRATGAISVRLSYDTEGHVFWVEALGGNPLLQSAAEGAACSAKFNPVLMDGRPGIVTGIITYNFMP